MARSNSRQTKRPSLKGIITPWVRQARLPYGHVRSIRPAFRSGSSDRAEVLHDGLALLRERNQQPAASHRTPHLIIEPSSLALSGCEQVSGGNAVGPIG